MKQAPLRGFLCLPRDSTGTRSGSTRSLDTRRPQRSLVEVRFSTLWRSTTQFAREAAQVPASWPTNLADIGPERVSRPE